MKVVVKDQSSGAHEIKSNVPQCFHLPGFTLFLMLETIYLNAIVNVYADDMAADPATDSSNRSVINKLAYNFQYKKPS